MEKHACYLLMRTGSCGCRQACNCSSLYKQDVNIPFNQTKATSSQTLPDLIELIMWFGFKCQERAFHAAVRSLFSLQKLMMNSNLCDSSNRYMIIIQCEICFLGLQRTNKKGECSYCHQYLE